MNESVIIMCAVLICVCAEMKAGSAVGHCSGRAFLWEKYYKDVVTGWKVCVRTCVCMHVGKCVCGSEIRVKRGEKE